MSETLNFHFIAIGGIGMSGLAKYLIEMGHNVSGSDLEETKYTQKIQKIGAKVYIGHKEEQVPDNSIVVASTAIRETNPEINIDDMDIVELNKMTREYLDDNFMNNFIQLAKQGVEYAHNESIKQKIEILPVLEQTLEIKTITIRRKTL